MFTASLASMQCDSPLTIKDGGHALSVMRPRIHAQVPSAAVADMQSEPTYGMRMRNADEQRKAWGIYFAALREATGLSQKAFGERISVDPATVWRYENGRQKPESTEVPERIHAAFGIPLDEVMAAAGLKPDFVAPTTPSNVVDVEIERVRRSGLSRRIQKQLEDHIERERQRDLERRMAQTEFMIRNAGGKVG